MIDQIPQSSFIAVASLEYGFYVWRIVSTAYLQTINHIYAPMTNNPFY